MEGGAAAMSEFTVKRIHVIIIVLGAMIWIVACSIVGATAYFLFFGGR
jgi:hypothetical protein